jgi:ribose transport system ATP-binding protein
LDKQDRKNMEINKKPVLLRAEGIVKDFPGVRALDDANLELEAGEIHALVGENGAGKSTLAKILAGVISPDEGKIYIDGKEIKIRSPREAQVMGIAMAFQELNLVPSLTIGSNLFLSHELKTIGGLVDISKIHKESKKILLTLGLDIDPYTKLSDLSIAQQQMVAIVRALTFNTRILILDEPTSSLTNFEINKLFEILKKLKTQGIAIIYVSHRLEEVFQIADSVTVLRDGKMVGTLEASEANVNKVVVMMVGREISDMYPKKAAILKDEALRLVNITKYGVCEEVNLCLHQGEVVGLYGLVGASRTDVARIIFGMESYDKGDIYILGKKVGRTNPNRSVALGIGFLTEDRKNEGLCMNLSVKQNIIRASLKKLFPTGFINPGSEEVVAKKYIDELNIATPSTNQLVFFLSGGTQQKVVLSQWICTGSKIMILDEPTHGIDVGAKVEIYQIINRLVKDGVAILLISSDLPEILGMSDRIYVMRRGRLAGEFIREKCVAEDIVSCAIGVDKVNDAAI